MDKDNFPEALEVTAWTEDGTVMALRHRDLPIEGVQFHPESIITETGKTIIQNWLDSLSPPNLHRLPVKVLAAAGKDDDARAGDGHPG